MATRKCVYSEHIRKEASDEFLTKVEVGEALFHCWGVDYDECDSGCSNYSTAIIELPCGQVKSIPAEHIRFIEVQNDGQ